MSLEAIIGAFDLQARWCDEMASPFTAGLLRHAVEDMRGGGPVAALLHDWSGNPLADALMMRFAGALHAAALSRRDEKLAALYPETNPNWDIDAVWVAARDFIVREDSWVHDFLQSPPQTNETRRAIALLPAFLELARTGPLHLLEIGASAGLNQNWDGFRFETRSWTWGEEGGPWIDTDWRGPAPADLDVRPVIASRAACDRNPLDVRNPEHVLRLSAYVWADQADRFTRLQAAIALARAMDTRVGQADAGEWLAQRLSGDLPRGTTVLYHSVVWQYLSQTTKDAVTAAMTRAAARADATHRLAWMRYEPARLLGLEGPIDQMVVDLTLWPNGERRIFARTDGHARAVEYLPA